MKKFLSSVALAGLLLTGVSVSQASADTAFVNSGNLAANGASFSTTGTDSSTVVIPEGVSTFRTEATWILDEAFLVAHAGQKLTYTVSVKDPSNVALPLTYSVNSSTGGYSKSEGGSIYKIGGGGNFVTVDWQTGSLTIPTEVTGYAGSYTPFIDVYAPNSQTGGLLEAGTYTVTTKLFAAGTEITQKAGFSRENLNINYFVGGNSVVIPDGITSAQFSAIACVDASKVAVGDVVKAEFYTNDVLSNTSASYWETRSEFRSDGDAGYRRSDYASTATITEYDITNGVGVRVSNYNPNVTAGDEYDLKYKLYNTSTNEDVSGDCAPAKPAAPTASYMMSSISVSGEFSFGSSRYNSVCNLYDKAAPTVVVATGYVNSQSGSSSYSCSISASLSSSKTYVVKFGTVYQGKPSPLSDPSADIVVPASGYTITTSYAGTVAAGKVVKVNDNSLLVEDTGSYVGVIPDGKGGIYTIGFASSCNISCGTSQFRIRHMTNSALDTTFAGTGSVVLNSFNLYNSNAYTMGYFGTNKDKWVVPVLGFEGSGGDGKAQFIFGNAANATTTTKTVDKAAFDTACNAGAAGYGQRPNYAPSVSVISAPTANPFISITCYKEYTLAGAAKAWLSVGVLATIDPATGNISVKGSLGTPSDTANGFSARTTVNHSATGNEPMITAFVSSYQYTSYNDQTLQGTGTVADHSIIRIKADGTFLGTTNSAWGASGGSSGSDVLPSIASVNSGKIYGILRAGLVSNLATITSTGAVTLLPIDTTAATVTMPIIGLPGGFPISSDETLIPVYLSGMNQWAAGWVNVSTGVLTQGEKLVYTSNSGNGSQVTWLNGNDKNTYLLINATTAPNNLTVLKWIDSRYTVPTGPVPTVTSKNLKYAKNTPAAGTKVTLTGTNLNGVTSATIGGNAAALGTKSATSLQLTVPTASSAGTVDIVLTTADGATTVDTFTYVGTGVEQSVEVADLAASVNLGAADLALSATVTFSPNDVGTQGAITWSSDTPTVCSIVSGKAHFLTGGTCTVKATAAASGLLLAGSDTETLTVNPGAQTITLSGPTNPEVDLDGIDLTASTNSGLALTFATSTAGVCSVDSTGHVTPITAGECVVTASQAGNASWLSDSKQATIVFTAPATTPIVDNGNPASPTTLSKTGAWVKNGDTQLSWNRTKGTLAFKVSIVYVGPIKGTAVFKIGSKTHTCVVNFGTLKKQATSKRLVLTSPNLCSGSKEKVQLAALKKAPVNMVVKLTIVRDMKFPTTYAKYRTKTRVIYAKLG